MKRSVTVGKLMSALAKSQASFPKFVKDKAAYNYNYLTLDRITEAVLPILGNNNIAVTQEHRVTVIDEAPFVVVNSYLFCEDEYIENTLMFPLGEPNKGMTEIMQCGAQASYLRRFALLAMLGIAGGDKDIEIINDEEINTKLK